MLDEKNIILAIGFNRSGHASGEMDYSINCSKVSSLSNAGFRELELLMVSIFKSSEFTNKRKQIDMVESFGNQQVCGNCRKGDLLLSGEKVICSLNQEEKENDDCCGRWE